MRSILILITFLMFTTLHAQIVNIDKVKFGRISNEEMTMTVYESDTDAEAVVLYDKATLRMDYDQGRGGFQYIMERHLRIKILRPSGTHYGDFVLSLENSTRSTAKEEVINMRAATFNWVNGKMEEIKIPKDAIFIEDVTDSYQRYKLAFPQVKEGSVLEMKYVFQSDFLYKLPTWYFQKEIPVDYSSYEVSVPEYFSYNLDMKGFASNTLVENVVGEIGADFVMVRVGGNNGRPSTDYTRSSAGNKSTRRFDFSTINYRWAAVRVPKLSEENYSPNVKNYFFKISFELANVSFPGSFSNNYSRNWKSISDNYLQHSRIDSYKKPRKQVRELAASWTMDTQSSADKTQVIYERLKESIVWDEWFSMYPRHTPTNLLKMKTGNSADINFLLLSMLTAEGILAEPVLVSTRNHGAISYTSPSLMQFNHVIILVNIDDENQLLLDVTGKNVPWFLVPKYNINDLGRVMRKDDASEWLDMAAPATDKMAIQFQLTLDNDGQLTGTVKIKAEDYAALDFRNDMKVEIGDKASVEESDMKAYFENWTSSTFEEVEATNFGDINEDVIIAAAVDFSNQVINGGEMFYIPSVLMKQFNENPFKTETRDLPIDFIVPQIYVYSTQITLPEGMALEELPESINFALPDDKARYSIRYFDLNGSIQIIEKLTISEPFYSSLDYAALRKFFNLVLEKQEIPLVVK